MFYLFRYKVRRFKQRKLIFEQEKLPTISFSLIDMKQKFRFINKTNLNSEYI